MLCSEFEDRLTDYLDGALASEAQRAFAEHALRCPVCHELLSEVKNTIVECRADVPPAPSVGLEARIMLKTAPETAMSCEEFEEHLTDYLDGFLPATLFHRWERHAALCERCTELPGQVVRSIGACYSYISEERPVPAGLHARILQATLGTTEAERVRAPFAARLAEWMRGWLDAVVAPQFATVATMVLIAVLVGTSTLSDDGSIGGMYRASLRLAAQTYQHGASTATKAAQSDDLKRVAESLENLVGQPTPQAATTAVGTDQKPAESNEQTKPAEGGQPPQEGEQKDR
ncbi:MAG TPA: zf-HC2 domain-containing protein [Pyrinomonadaceae bacterium]|nr:zf-HC2 domain-containing protein [Pyrinomonadaceae bacterium]